MHFIDMTANQDIVEMVTLPLLAGDLLRGNDGKVYVARSNLGGGPKAAFINCVTNTLSTAQSVKNWLEVNYNFELIARLDEPVK